MNCSHTCSGVLAEAGTSHRASAPATADSKTDAAPFVSLCSVHMAGTHLGMMEVGIESTKSRRRPLPSSRKMANPELALQGSGSGAAGLCLEFATIRLTNQLLERSQDSSATP